MFAAAVVRALIRAHGRRAFDRYIDLADSTERLVWDLLASKFHPTSSAVNVALQSLNAVDPTAGPTSLLDAAGSLIRALAQSQPICVPVTADAGDMDRLSRTRIDIERRVIPRVAEPGSIARVRLVARAEAIIKLALGVPPRLLYFELEQFARSRSLYVEVAGPPGTFISRFETLQQGPNDQRSAA